MGTFNIYKLHFTSPLHISDRRDDSGKSLRAIHSDTMYAALIDCLAKTGHKIPDGGDLGFTISSLFPYYQEAKGDNPIYFLPMPFQTHMPELKDVTMAKKVKKVQWVDSSLFSQVLNGISFFEESEKYLQKIQSSYLTERELPIGYDCSKEFVYSEVFQRVRKEDRTGKEDAWPYYIDRITFKDMSGLFFLVDGNTTLLDKAIKLLALEGIGTDKNIGFGVFEYEKDTIIIDTPTDSDFQVSLSLLIPETQEQLKTLMASDKVAYDFERRGGWITTYPHTTLRKNAIYGFLPGSVFCGKGNNCIGKIVNLQPFIDDNPMTPFPIWRNGKSIMLPIILK